MDVYISTISASLSKRTRGLSASDSLKNDEYDESSSLRKSG